MIYPNVNNEWDPLKKIIVGTVTNSQIPPFKDRSLHCVDYAHLSNEEFEKVPTGRYPKKIVEETREDLAKIKDTLRSFGITVLTHPIDESKKPRPYHDSYYDYCPRDSMLVIGDKVIQTPMALRHRRDEADKYKKMFKTGSWVEFPKPILEDSMYDRSDLSKPTLQPNPEPVFDAANILKANNDIIYLVSNTGNLAGADYLEKWLWDNVSTDYKVHRVEGVYAHIHIDTTFVLLREGLVLCNPVRVNENNIPQIFRNWDRIWAPEPYPTQAMEEWCPASPWLGMNILSINENLVMVEEHQLLLMNLLKKYGIESIPVRLRHSRTFSGGPHCITLDVIRSTTPTVTTKNKQTII